MNRVLNDPDLVVEDMLKGWLLAHGDSVVPLIANPRVVKRIQAPERGKVGVITGGGSGHEPAFLGYVGNGLIDAVAIGEIFSSPTARNFLDAARAADGGAGVVCLYGNYAGDNMNVAMARSMAEREGIAFKTVVANDDVPSARRGDERSRRGVAGEILMWKVGAAKAALGGSIDEVVATAQRAIANTRSIGIGLSACVIPAVGKANFHIAHGTMEVGIGHHGEPGIDIRPTVIAAEMAAMMLSTVLPDLPFKDGDRVAVLLSGLGATPVMEQYILYGEIAKRLTSHGIVIVFSRVGNLFTSLEMMGVTLTLMRLDEELEACLRYPCSSVGLSVSGDASAERTYHGRAVVDAPVNVSPARGGDGAKVRSPEGASADLAQSGKVVRDLIDAVVSGRERLSEIDGRIGDGDHGINMAKGFKGCAARLDALGDEARSLPVAFEQLAQALMDDIGGSMGPLYGTFFRSFGHALRSQARLDAALFEDALKAGVDAVLSMGDAKVGDKTLVDVLVPARDAWLAARATGADFGSGLEAMSAAAERGRDSTKALQSRVGRSARLGARSIGFVDAGATSCCLILQTLASSLAAELSVASNDNVSGEVRA